MIRANIWATPVVLSITSVVAVFGVVALGTFAAVAQRKASVARFGYTFSAIFSVACVPVTSVGISYGIGIAAGWTNTCAWNWNCSLKTTPVFLKTPVFPKQRLVGVV
jgi:hypothetical protein